MEGSEPPKPVPAYYCCYLLRSTVRHASLYIGSTPNPIRRLPQHNGVAKGGAKRTARDKLRPWEMCLVVEGFMTRVGALQFEWAWQHPERSRHLEPEDEGKTKVNIDPKTGKPKPKPRARARRSLTAHLEDLHSLLRSTYFSSWPLRVRFFRADVWRVWRAWNDRVDSRLPQNIKTILDGDNLTTVPNAKQTNEHEPAGCINNLSVDYARLEDYLEKSMFMLEDPEDLQCTVCNQSVTPNTEQIVVCPQPDCRAGSLGTSPRKLSFMRKDRPMANDDARAELPQPRRKRGTSDSAKKEKRLRKESAAEKASIARSTSMEPGVQEEDSAHDELSPDWTEGLDPESDSDFEGRHKHTSSRPPSKLEVVIEDSDWDDAELVE
ncbi:uncharacterized protein N7506_007620 [Penicillium brevicompactum]|uniref:uncharacterized protein n=1 Tax=Penicillium brevicompactum TaxID=5074 RepID=UPI002541369F|nr:uncharacterized protein N7506_007620 [Penicillium brevicompactum]KAJ5333837.1 hypothetical protein N7506_007620 [Penicillium brevicompactum]